jgi:type I restriction enzyme S subunit
LKRVKLPCPPITIQRKIAAILSTWDRAIELTEKLIAAKQQRKAGLMQQLLTGKARLPQRTLAEVTSILTGFPFPSEEFAESGRFRLVRGSNVKRSELDWSPEITRYWPDPEGVATKYHLRDGDIVIAMDGALVGRSYAKVAAADLPALLVQRVARLRCESIQEADYIFQQITSPAFRRAMESVKTNTAIPHISPGDISNFSIWWPAPELRHQIAAILNTQDREIGLLHRKMDALRRQKKGLMQQLLTDKVRVKVTESSGE